MTDRVGSRRVRWGRWFAVGSLVVGVTAAAVDCAAPRRPLTAQCAFNDECTDPLVCAGNVCRAQCRSDRDCPSGTTCRPSDQADKNVCLPPEAPALCVYDSDCGDAGPLICARDGVCRNQCNVDADCRSYGQGIIALACDTAMHTCVVVDGGTSGDAAPSDSGGPDGTPTSDGAAAD